MNPNPDAFSAAARAFRKSRGPKIDLLTPHASDIRLLRKSGASFPVIVNLLQQSGLTVSADTVRRFCSHQPKGESSTPTVKTPPPEPSKDINPEPTPISVKPSYFTELPRRGPRIADPRNL
jgi:hypothetical protein